MSFTSRSSSKKGKKSSSLKLVNLFLLLIYSVLALVLGFLLLSYNILAFRYVNVLIFLVGLAIFLVACFLIVKQKAKKFTAVLLTLSTLVSAGAIFAVNEALTLSNRLTISSDYSEYEMSIAVLADSEVTDIHQLTSVLAPTDTDSENIQTLLDDLSATQSVTLTADGTPSYLSAYQSLLSGEAKAIVLNSVFESIIETQDADYASKIRKIYTRKLTKKVEATNQESKNSDVFNLYISGIDTYGPVSSVSRSDVNIIMTINRTTKKVLLTTTPRDAYVPIADGGANQPDKLTHAGIYGIDASIHTLENLYGIDINYYVRLNFTSFIKLIDLVGGIDVYNDQEFTSLHGKYHFAVGEVHLDSDQALGFVRERYSLAGGDNDRGKNQEKVIAAILKKLTSKEVLSNYSEIISGLQDSIQTDMPFGTLMNLINTQLETGGSYQVTSQALEGTGATGLPSYAMPGAELYMMEINQDSLASVKAAMNAVLEGN